jgi:hypothetical protein
VPESGLGMREQQLEIVPLMMMCDLASCDAPEPQKYDRSNSALHAAMTVRAQPGDVRPETASSAPGFE